LFLLMFSLSIFCHHGRMSYYGDASSSSAIRIVFKTVFPFSSGIHLSTYYSVLQYKHCKKKKESHPWEQNPKYCFAYWRCNQEWMS
jgi:hypothetical protein